jgi:predicted nucleic acid-binding Zn ribbon protein
MEARKCVHCGAAFVPKRAHGQFCSPACRVRYNRWLKKDMRERTSCLRCGDDLDDKRAGAKYCSDACRAAAWNEAQPFCLDV